MKRLLHSFQAALLFVTLLFALQCLLFFYAPSFYLPALRQLALPDFIVEDLIRRLGLIGGLYLVWAVLLAAINALLFRRSKSNETSGDTSFGGYFFLAAAQTAALYGLIAWHFPSILGFVPGLLHQPLIWSYAEIAGLGVGCLTIAAWLGRVGSLRQVLALGSAALLPALLHLFLVADSTLNLPPAKTAADLQPRILLLGFDALDGDSGNSTLAKAAAGLGGRIFNQAFTPLPGTHPAWNSILNGVYPERHGVRFFFDSPLSNSAAPLSLQRRLQERHGGHSLFASDQPETSYFNQAQGFFDSVAPEVGWKAHLNAALLNHFVFPALWLNNSGMERIRGTSLNSPSLFNYDPPRFFKFSFRKFAALPEGAVLMALHTCHLHSPIRLNRKELSGLRNWLGLRPKDFSFWPWVKPGDPLQQTPANWHNPYFIRLPETLRLLGALVAELRAKRYFEDHRIVFLSDHGERFVPGFEIYGGIHGIDLKGRTQNNVLLGFFDPRWRELRMLETPVSLIDVAPSLISLFGGGTEGYDGASLFDAEARELRLAPRPLRGESMGLIASGDWPGAFPQIAAGELESQLSYRPDGSVVVGADYYRLILGRKDFVDLMEIPGMLGWGELGLK